MPVVSVLERLFDYLSFTQLAGWSPLHCILERFVENDVVGHDDVKKWRVRNIEHALDMLSQRREEEGS